ncbi:NADH-quinone oxidoreductase subunit L [Roseospira navarrensis]|uniref:Probable inorganic carbon transporter subunit DabB n=1 Tax=Roseospira navarrensis TaxID=140058 RepID=A0A7X1ZCK1_9PROT|nr:NADH-quinone oxidoreductase subunit L [Roseospira navarrensis]MQX35847.1 NADH-quinone oxidoreductase subunit L [Roseospira navarrensis]
MSPDLALWGFLAPLALIAVAVVAGRDPAPRPRRVLAASRVATVGALGLAIAAALFVAVQGPATSPLIGANGLGLSMRLDALSVTLFLLVAFVGVLVVQFSRNYMDGDPRQGPFIGGLCLTLASVMLMVTAGNLVLFAAAWIATSLAFHRLLVFYPERRKALLAARKKWIVARLGDVCVVGAAVLLAGAFGTTDIATLLERASAASDAAIPATVGVAAVLIALAALLKSAQFPTHGWLTEVMETPTPVSALLHAGLINAGGFLAIRFADVLLLAPGALYVLAIVGGVTALFGAAVMLTQPSVKVSIAWSTVAQMGFMLLQCGLGLFTLAVLHLVAHSLYKAHAFLSSGSVVEIKRAAWIPDATPPRAGRVLVSVGLALALYAGLAWVSGSIADKPLQLLAMGAILVMALTVLFAQAMVGVRRPSPYVVGRTVAMGGVVTVAYFALHAGAGALLGGAVPPPPPADSVAIVVMGLLIAVFTAITVLQIVEPSRTTRPAWQAARVHLANGLYANALFDRLIGAMDRARFTPAPAAPVSLSTEPEGRTSS